MAVRRRIVAGAWVADLGLLSAPGAAVQARSNGPFANQGDPTVLVPPARLPYGGERTEP